jgi:predicted transcriptional regulator
MKKIKNKGGIKMYKISIDTNNYKNLKCSKKNWENGTVNDYMNALNGWNRKVNDIQEVIWQIEMFAHNCHTNCWDNEKEDYTEKFKQWSTDENKITYYDNLCEFNRESKIEVYGFAQGYFDIEKILKELEEKNIIQIPFKWCYDLRQYSKNMNGCYMQIEKLN